MCNGGMSDDTTHEEHFRALEDMYHAAPVNTTIPSRLKVGDGKAEVEIQVGSHLWHAAHALHGSMYFKALDDAAFFAANSVETKGFVLTAKFEITMLEMIRTSVIRSVGTLVRREGRKIWAGSVLFDGDGKKVASGEGLFIVSAVPLRDLAPGNSSAST